VSDRVLRGHLIFNRQGQEYGQPMPALGAAVDPGGHGQAVLADLGFDAHRLGRRRSVAPALTPLESGVGWHQAD